MQLEEGLIISKGFDQIVPKLHDGKDHVQGVQYPVILELIFNERLDTERHIPKESDLDAQRTKVLSVDRY